MDATNRVVAGWILEERLGSGGFGEVWRARRRHVDLFRALKLVPISSESTFASWRHEISRLEELSHPNIVRFYDADIVSDAGPYDDFAWIATELCDRSLADELQRREGRILGSAECMELVDAMLGALAAAHGSGCVHRDLKPANILMHPSGAWKLCDFGTARLIPPGESHPRTAVVGTFPYMSPTAHRGRQDQAADLYALGVTLHEALCGRRLHVRTTGMTDSEYVKSILDTPPTIYPGLDHRWQALVAALIGARGVAGAGELLGQLRRTWGAGGPPPAMSLTRGLTAEPVAPAHRPPALAGPPPAAALPAEASGTTETLREPAQPHDDRDPTRRERTLRQPRPPAGQAPRHRWWRRRGRGRSRGRGAGYGEREHVVGILSLLVGSLAMAGVLLYQLIPNPLALAAIFGTVVLILLLLVALS